MQKFVTCGNLLQHNGGIDLCNDFNTSHASDLCPRQNVYEKSVCNVGLHSILNPQGSTRSGYMIVAYAWHSLTWSCDVQ